MRRLTEYFAGATYDEWEDIEPPIVKVARDASIAWVITHVRVRRTQNAEAQDFEYAGSTKAGSDGQEAPAAPLRR